jgi:hypothetical protein
MLGDKVNPSRIKPGEIRNPGGRPKGSTSKKYNIKERLLGKYQTHPVDRLVKLANELEYRGQFEEAAAIWENLLKYFEPTKKPVESAPEKPSPEGSVEAAEETFRLLQEMEQDGLKPTESSKGDGLEGRPTNVPPEASPKTDLPGHKEQ